MHNAAPFRCVFGVADDLQQFARDFLLNQRGNLAMASSIRDVGNAQVAVLHIDGQFQVELCVMQGGAVIPMHRHPHADTIEIGVAGAVRLSVCGIDPFSSIPDDRLARFTAGRGIRINAGDLHGGVVLKGGAMFLSVQRWTGKPTSVLVDYVGEPVSPAHGAAL